MVEGDGFTVEIKDEVCVIDIFNSGKVLESLLKNID